MNFDKNYFHVEGQNYPYGVSVSLAGSQPIFSNGIKWVSENIIDISKYAVGIMNLAILFMLIPTALLLFLILCRFKLPPWYSLLVSLGIAFCSPQIHRWMIGHYGLSYTIVIPLTWYLLLRFYEKPSYLLSGLIMLNATIWGFVQMYYVLVLSVFVFLFWGVAYFKDRKRWKFSSLCPHVIVQIFFPLFITAFFMLFGASFAGQVSPGNVYRTHLEGVLLPYRTPFIKIFEMFIDIRNLNHEDLNYIGIVGVFIFFFCVIRIIRFIKAKNFHRVCRLTRNTSLMISLLAAFIALVLAMADPFRYFPLVEHFRSLGRLVWPFFYVFTVFSFYSIYLMFRYLKIRGFLSWARTLLIVSLCFLFLEAAILNKNVSSEVSNKRLELHDETFSLPLTQWMRHVDVDRYQAIIPLPYFFDLAGRFSTGRTKYVAFILSMKTGLPLTAANISRYFQQDWDKQREFFDPKIKKKRIVEDYPNQKPFLILATHDELRPEEEALLRKAIPLFKNEEIRVFELPFERISG
ncbi:hypothetical protein ACFLRA_01665 [Bdellovibrionota bacterium]